MRNCSLFPYCLSVLLFFVSFSFFNNVQSQTTVQITAGTAGTPAYNAGPIYRSASTSAYDASRYAYLYTQAELAAVGIFPGSVISEVGWTKSNADSTNGGAIFRIFMKNSAATDFSAATELWSNLNSGATMVYESLAQHIPATIAPDYITFSLSTPFLYSGGSLEISTEWDINGVSGTATSGTFSWLWSTVTDRIYGTGNTTLAPITSLSSTSNSISTIDDRRPFLQVTFSPGTPCSGTPAAGTASSDKSFVCIGESFQLSVSGADVATGITYQWQSSPDNTVWTDIPGASGLTYTASQSATSYYRCVVTCTNGGASSSSTSVQVTSPLAVSGTFTINNGLPTGGTNFASFNDAYNYIKCGINGPVVFNVDPASGPYTEQLILEPVSGASATNTITFNGNGRTIQFASTNTNERAVIKLNGADHFIFDSLSVVATGTTTSEYGFGFHLINDADSNIIRKCMITMTDALTSSNYAGIAMSASHTSATGTGNAECDGNEISGNTVKGGYYGITNTGSSSLANQNNRITDNIIQDFYTYGIYVYGSFNVLVQGNDISRPTRSNLSSGTSYGIYFSNLNTKALINGNYIHGLLDADPTSTNDMYGIYFTGVDALATLENIVSNNLIFDMKSNGTIYGIYNSSSDNVWYYHNTISLDDASSTATELTRAFYQTTSAGGIEFKNNLITLRRGGTGAMYALYFNTINPSDTIQSYRNDVFFNPAANINFGRFGTNDAATLTDWQALTNRDTNSLIINPVYTNLALNNLKPTSPGLNDLGIPVGVTTDIVGVARNATTPDIGAYEFDVGGCSAPPLAGDATSSVSAPICPGELVALGLTNNSIGTGQTYVWQSATSLAGPWTDISPVQNIPGFNLNPTTTLFYRCAVSCSGSTTYSTPVEVVVNSLFPGGTYTINSGQPTGGTNFQSFNDAALAMRCGIAGPVVFNVVAGSGPYNEQVIFGEIQGASATNTVTFNGNGEIITYLSTNTNDRAVIKLNGTDHFIFDSLTVEPQGSTTSQYGFGFHLQNNADSNIIRNCTINLNTSSTSSNFAGIVSSVGVSASSTGTNESDYNLIENNTITGGYYGITSVGSSSSAVGNNIIRNNTVRDFYSYGIFLYGNFNTLVEGNDISRPTRGNTTTHYGIYVSSLNTALQISKNRIHNPFDGIPTSTSSFYGIYFTGVDAIAGLENVVSNNIIYNVNGNGTEYALYNSSSDNAWYYHNTINLDDANATTSSSTYGFYQSSGGAGIELKDNIFSISRSSSGTKYCLYFASFSSTTFTSNYNNFYRNAANANTGYNGTARVTLADWRTATGEDLNSRNNNPFFTDPANGNLEPRSSVLDNKGTPVGILTDINDNPRSTTTPDMGAYEYIVPPCTAPPTAGTADATPNSNVCMGSPIELTLLGNTEGAGQTYQWQVAGNLAGPYTNLGTVHQFADTTIPAAGTLYYRCIVTCTGMSDTSAPVMVNMNPPFPAGTYTINNAQPTDYPSGINFNSFVEAVAVMECGIDGPVTFNVAPGTYTEQVRMHLINGATANSRVTFQSANGDPAGVILTYGGATSGANYVLQLDSASYITYKGITITSTGTTYGRVVDISSIASYDSLLNCVIDVPSSSSTSNNISGIYASVVGSDNVIKGNTITGGSSGIYFSAPSSTTPSMYNVIDSNTVSGTYYYGIYNSNSRYHTVTNNTINVTAPRNTSSYGIYTTNCDSAFRYEKNKVTIENTTTTVYGMYFTGNAADDGMRGSISGNKIIANNGLTGTTYGMYNSSTQDADIFNNIINVSTSATTSYGLYSTGGLGGLNIFNNSVQNSSASTGTTNIAAYFSHSSATAGRVDIRNNVFTHNNGGIAMYQNNTGNVYLDYNMYYTAGPILIRRSTVNYATLQEWRDAENWDYSSIVYTPAFAAGNDLVPDIANPDVWAMHGRGVQIDGNDKDYNGNVRSTTLVDGVPDLGAYEFLPTVDPPNLPSVPAAPAAGTTQVFMFGTDTVSKITWAPASSVPTQVNVKRYSGIIPPGLASGQQSMYFYTDVDITGSAPSSYTMEQFYIDSWLRDIPSEPTVKLGRTDAANAWIVASTSSVDAFNNVMTESGLSFIDRFTGMTDGQAPPPPPDDNLITTDTSNRGNRFWVAYGHHQGFSSNGQDMVLYLSAEDSANVTVKVNGTNWVRHYAIPANTVKVSDLMPKSGLVDSRILDEGLFNTGISIESDVPIVAYAHIYQGANSGAGMLLPTGVYGYEYTTLNYKQYYASDCYSWFYVIADRDSTLVEITPSVDTKGGRPAGVPFQVYLNKGDVYNVMGTTSGATGTDLTGSKVKSIPNASGKCYPIAVFSGSSRTAICYTTNGDNFIQQVFPNQAWGKKYLTFSSANSGSTTNYNSNIFRVLVKDPTTVVTVNGVTLNPATLNPGNFYEFNTTQGNGQNGAVSVEADKPVLVSQYMVSTSANGCPGVTATGNGDPEMIYISPVEQGIKRAVFYNTDESAITSNYINVVIPTAGLSSLTIDGSNTFTDVFAHPYLAGYTCVRQNLGAAASQHIIQSDSAFTAITYGLGSVESYGYNAGTLVKNLNAIPFISNVLSASGGVSDYTCKGAPFRFRVQLNVKPDQLVWHFSDVNNLSPNADVTQNNPTAVDSTLIGGVWYYTFTVAADYNFLATGNYLVPITISHPSIESCNNRLDITLPVSVIQAPATDFSINFSGCIGDMAQFSGSSTTSNGVPVNQWSWDFGDGNSSTLQNPSNQYNTAGTFDVMLRAIANDGCVGDTTKQLVVNAKPAVVIANDSVGVCSGDNVTFTIQNPLSGATYNWYDAATGGTLLGTGTSYTVNNVTSKIVVFAEAVLAGCSSDTRDRATAYVLPNVSAPVVVVDSLGADLIRFRWNAVPNAASYEVSTDNGTTWQTPSSGPLGLTHTITGLQPRTSRTLIVRANGGCQQAVSGPVTGTTLTDQIFIPNSFTPNGDGLNDVLRVYGYVIKDLRFMIFNQWGEKVFETRSQVNGWDGRYKGKLQPSGVYMYVCEMVLADGRKIQKKGSINLIR